MVPAEHRLLRRLVQQLELGRAQPRRSGDFILRALQQRSTVCLVGWVMELPQLIDAIDGIVWEVDYATFRFSFVSRQAERLLGYPLDDWHAAGFWEGILHPEDRERAVRYCVTSAERLESHDFEYRVLARDGHVVWVRDPPPRMGGTRMATKSGILAKTCAIASQRKPVSSSEEGSFCRVRVRFIDLS